MRMDNMDMGTSGYNGANVVPYSWDEGWGLSWVGGDHVSTPLWGWICSDFRMFLGIYERINSKDIY